MHRRNLELMMIGDPTRIDDLTVAMQRRNHALTRFRSRFLGYRDTLGPSLRQTCCPVLAIQGVDDEYGTMAQIDGIAAAAPQTVLLKLDDCGHSPHRDQPLAPQFVVLFSVLILVVGSVGCAGLSS